MVANLQALMSAFWAATHNQTTELHYLECKLFITYPGSSISLQKFRLVSTATCLEVGGGSLEAATRLMAEFV